MALPNSSDTVSKKRMPVDISPTIGAAYQLSVSTTSARQALTAGVGRISIFARGCDMKYLLGGGSVAADNVTSHWISAGERLDFQVDSGQSNIAAIAASGGNGTSGTLEITEIG